jgi:cation:H+ antiporter
MNWLAIPALLASILMISKGADWLTGSVWRVSLRKRISAGMLGMAVAGLMTTLPEVTVSSMASAMRSPDLSIGNAIGSTIFNVLGIIGIIGLIRPLNFDREFLRDFGRNAILAYFAFFILAFLGRSLGMADAVILLGVMALSLYLGYRRRYVGAPTIKAPSGSSVRDTLVILAGGVVLGSGSYLLIFSARSIAAGLGVPEVVIGLSMVAVGTSIPELATGLASMRRGIEEISIGNVLGANVYNVTLVLGAATLIGTLLHGTSLVADAATLYFDIPVMIGATALLMIVGRKGTVSRRSAVIFLLLYAIFLAVTFTRGGAG